MHERSETKKMRISFDLDETLFVSPITHKTEPPLPGLLRRIYRERLRKGTPALINELQARGFEVWVYTSSFRMEWYIKRLFHFYGVHFDGIVNAYRHLAEVQEGHPRKLPQKVPTRYGISLHVDDEDVILSYAREYGFEGYKLDEPDDAWVVKLIARAEEVRRKKFGG